jgi:sugar O-acyltransferase (sialic acid O-acetyltransferase NeuD family)
MLSNMKIVVVGAGSQGATVADILQRASEAGATAVPVGFVDDTPELLGTTILGLPVLGAVSSLAAIQHDAIVVAIGDNRLRRIVTERLIAGGERLATAIHPFISIAPSARIGEGSMISAGAVLMPRATIGRGAMLSTKSSIDHDSVLGDFAHLSAGATVGGKVWIGDESLIALGASVTSGMKIGARTIIGAGSVVVRDIPDDVVAFGVPARVRSDRRSENLSG